MVKTAAQQQWEYRERRRETIEQLIREAKRAAVHTLNPPAAYCDNVKLQR